MKTNSFKGISFSTRGSKGNSGSGPHTEIKEDTEHMLNGEVASATIFESMEEFPLDKENMEGVVQEPTFGSTQDSTLMRRMSTKIQNFRHKITSSAGKNVYADESFIYVNGVLNPYSIIVRRWNKLFLLSGLAAFGVDPLFFYALLVDPDRICAYIQTDLATTLTILRSCNDLIYLVHILLQFRIAYVSLETMRAGRGELVVSKQLIALNYMTGPFVGDLIALLPLPQLAIWIFIPRYLETSNMMARVVLVIALLQYIPRMVWMTVHYRRMKRATGVVFETVASGFVLNLFIYLLLSHIVGACWYLFALQRVETCMSKACRKDPLCSADFLQCDRPTEAQSLWRQTAGADLTASCFNLKGGYEYGIYDLALDIVTVKSVVKKWLFSFFWGLQALSTTADNLTPSKSATEILFVIILIVMALLLFSLLVANMQTFLSSLGNRVDDYRSQLRNWEDWMKHRRIPAELKKQIKEYGRHWWAATHGVEEEDMLDTLPRDLRSKIKFHMCMNLVCHVPLFHGLHYPVRQALCEGLHQRLFTRGTYPQREGDPVCEMIFVLRGEFEAFHEVEGTKRGRCYIRADGFYGIELLRYLLEKSDEDSLDDYDLPPAQSTLRCIESVDAFALNARDLNYVIKRFKLREDGKLLETLKRHQEDEQDAFIRAEIREYQARLAQEQAPAGAASEVHTSRPSELQMGNRARSTSISAVRFDHT